MKHLLGLNARYVLLIAVLATAAISIAATMRDDTSWNMKSTVDYAMPGSASVTDTTQNTDTLVYSADASNRKYVDLWLRFPNINDSVRAQQYCSAGDKWYDLKITWKNMRPTTLSSKMYYGSDTSATWFSRVGTDMPGFFSARIDITSHPNAEAGTHDLGNIQLRGLPF